MRKTVGIIGFGNMGSAIAERIKTKYQVFVFDKDKNKIENLKGIDTADSSADLVNKVETIILAVKPQDFEVVLNEIKDYTKDKLIISIAAGKTTAYIEKALTKARIVRVMPNIGVKIGEAESSLCKGKSAKGEDLNFVSELFGYLGKTWVIKEGMIDAATAICGSGPAYIFYDMEKNNINPMNVPEKVKQEYIDRLKIAAEEVGFDHATAFNFAAATTGTSIALVALTPPQELRKQVTSRGGTTEAALEVLIAGRSWTDAAKAALKRAAELSKKE
ncbi:MAG: pyrroline-5-carboxylate reductase [Candidatus Omnitrophota bacterium]|nr:pyrroline-5-carboxylate reductase [Candidatus Omnitrophota bacterium]